MSVILSGFAVAKPSSAPAAVAGTVSGALDQAALYGYKVTYVTGFGETDPSVAVTVTTTSSGSVSLSSIPVSTNGNVYARKLYRTVGGGSSYLLLTTINNNSTTTYSDIIADGSLGAAAPTLNSAHSLQSVEGNIKMVRPAIYSVERGITAGSGGSSAAAYQLSAEYNWVSVSAVANDSVKLPQAATSLIGSHIAIRNNGANAIRVYPYDGQTINGGSVDAPVTVAAGASTHLVADLASNWAQV